MNDLGDFRSNHFPFQLIPIISRSYKRKNDICERTVEVNLAMFHGYAIIFAKGASPTSTLV